MIKTNLQYFTVTTDFVDYSPKKKKHNYVLAGSNSRPRLVQKKRQAKNTSARVQHFYYRNTCLRTKTRR